MKDLNILMTWDNVEYLAMSYIHDSGYLKTKLFSQIITEKLVDRIYEYLIDEESLSFDDISYRIEDIIETYVYAHSIKDNRVLNELLR